jgi:hypothetical protein
VVVEHGQFGDSYKCVSCGGEGMPLCHDDVGDHCNGGFTLANGKCTACGHKGLIACHDASGDHCDGAMQVVFGVCGDCGQFGQPRCPNGAACATGMEPQAGTGRCGAPWGAQGQRCGDNNACKSGLGCYDGVCDEGCGHKDQECCYTNTGGVNTRSVCKGGLTCGEKNHKTNCGGTPTPPPGPQCGVSGAYECGQWCSFGKHPTKRENVSAPVCTTSGESKRVYCEADCGTQFEACLDTCPNGYVARQTECRPGVCGACNDTGQGRLAPNWSLCVKQ